jgi:DNA-binding transcriptional ArsR family regulator
LACSTHIGRLSRAKLTGAADLAVGLDRAASPRILRYVPKYSGLDQIFHALGDSSRRAMVERLSRGPASVSELAKPFPVALPTVVQHLGVLETAGIVTSAKAGRVRTYQLVPGALDGAGDWIGRQRLPAERRLDRLGTFLNRPTTTKE